MEFKPMIFTLTVNLLPKKVATIEKKERKVHKKECNASAKDAH